MPFRRGTPVPGFTNAALTGPYTLAAGITTYTLLTPNGNTPDISDLSSPKYHHHPCGILTPNKFFGLFSASGTNEDAGGQFITGVSMNKDGSNISAPFMVFPPQSTWNGTGASTPLGGRVSYTRCKAVLNGTTYLTIATDDIVSGGRQGAALSAVQVNDDGSVGSPFLISTQTYTAQGGVATIPYDPVLGPPLYAIAKLYGRFGGSQPGTVASDWQAFTTQGGDTFTEPTTKALNSSNYYFARFWRKTTGTNQSVFWVQTSTDGGNNWTVLTPTNIPNSGSASWIGDVSATRSCFAFNPQDGATNRDPLALLTFNRQTGNPLAVNAIRQGLTQTPIYAGTNKLGGAQYPSFDADTSNIYVLASEQKETMRVTLIPLTSLPP